MDGDGYGDVLVGAANHDNGQSNEGRALVYLGSGKGLSSGAAWTAESDQAQAAFGTAVSSAGDVNGDGYSDVIVGAPLFDSVHFDAGRAYTYLGSSSGLVTSPAWTADGSNATIGIGASFGSDVSSAGDVNGDGYSDVIVGARIYTNDQSFEGGTFLHMGSATGLATSAAWTAEGNRDSFVADAGDVNGDGYGDVIVGASGASNGQLDEGRALVYLGNGGRGGWILAPQQRRTGGAAPIALLGRSNSTTGFELRVGFERTLAGFSWASPLSSELALEWEVEPSLGGAFDGLGIQTGSAQTVTGSPLSFDESVDGLTPHAPYRWRARLRSNNALFPVTPWFSLPGNGRTETKLRTRSTGGPRQAPGISGSVTRFP